MAHKSSPAQRPTSIVMTDWGANVESISDSPQTMLYELLLLSLVYDKVLIQDETLVLSNKIGKWISNEENRKLFEKIFDLGVLQVLTLPVNAYPTVELKDQAQESPFQARSSYIEQYGAKGSEPFRPPDYLKSAHKWLDWAIATEKLLHRPAGSVRNFDIMPAFSALLLKALEASLYDHWRIQSFPGITLEAPKTLSPYIKKPERARELGLKVLEENERPIFNRALAFALAEKLFAKQEARALQNLVQSVFAAPFSIRENAVGRYSGQIRPFPLVPKARGSSQAVAENVVFVEAAVHTIGLPDLTSDFVDSVRQVRESEVGKKLRDSIPQLGEEVNFNTQRERWAAVAEKLAEKVTPFKKIIAYPTLFQIGRGVAFGVLMAAARQIVESTQMNPTKELIWIMLGTTMEIVGEASFAISRNYLKHQEFQARIAHAIEFSCVEVPMLMKL